MTTIGHEPQHRTHCVQCGSLDAENPVHPASAEWLTRYMCDGCFAELEPVEESETSDRPNYKRDCAVCGERLDVRSMGSTTDASGNAVHRGCIRAPHRTELIPKFHTLPWWALTAEQRRWEDLYWQEHLEDLEDDKRGVPV